MNKIVKTNMLEMIAYLLISFACLSELFIDVKPFSVVFMGSYNCALISIDRIHPNDQCDRSCSALQKFY